VTAPIGNAFKFKLTRLKWSEIHIGRPKYFPAPRECDGVASDRSEMHGGVATEAKSREVRNILVPDCTEVCYRGQATGGEKYLGPGLHGGVLPRPTHGR
jgi:hypothetical protein